MFIVNQKWKDCVSCCFGTWNVFCLHRSAELGWSCDHQLLWGGLPPLILQSPNLTFWLRASIQRARKLWIEPWFHKHCGSLEQVISLSGLFCSCSNAAAEPFCTVKSNVKWGSSYGCSMVFPQKWKIHLPHDPVMPHWVYAPTNWQ